MSKEPLPEWAKPGAEVIIREPYTFGGGANHIRTKITRVTATSIFVKGHNGEYRFVTSPYYSTPQEYATSRRNARSLYPVDDPTIQADKDIEATKAALARARAAIDSWRYDTTDPDRTAEAITALQDYLAHQKANES